MHTAIIPIDPLHPDLEIIERAAALLRDGALVAFPTETVYGLGANALDDQAVASIYATKGRPSTNPLIAHISHLAMLRPLTGCDLADLPNAVQQLVRAYWPGPLTLVLPRAGNVPDILTAGAPTIAVRFPRHPIAQALIAALGSPVAAPSANRSGHVSPTTARHVWDDLEGRIPLILDGGACVVGIESTILDMTVDPPRLLRPGGLPVEQIEHVLGMPIAVRERHAMPATQAAPAPGMSITHYAPRVPLLVFEGHDMAQVGRRVIAEIRERSEAGQRVGALITRDLLAEATAAGAVATVDLGASADLEAAARHLFAGLRQLEDQEVDAIVTGSFVGAGLALALRDRLWRAAGGAITTLD